MMNSTNIADAAMVISNDAPNAASKLAEAYSVEATPIDKIRNEADGCTRLTEEIN